MGPAHSAADPALGADKAVSPGGAAGADRCFIETQFPVSRLSKESYKERKANYSQTLTGLGKWWGRKPLVMVRAIILGLLMPASANLRKDRDVFLALLTMDEEGLRRRKRRSIPLKEVYRRLSPRERVKWFAPDVDPDRPRLRRAVKAADRARLQLLVFDRLNYDEKLVWCGRPEQIDGPSAEAWTAINAHLGTTATSLPALVRELGERRRCVPVLHRDRLPRVRLARAACAELGHRREDTHDREPRAGAGGAAIRHRDPIRCRPRGAGRGERRRDGEAVAAGLSQPRVRRLHPDGGDPR